MRYRSSAALLIAAALPLFTADAVSQESAAGVRNSVSVFGGYGAAPGEWTQHPYAPVPFFKQSFVIGGEVVFRLSDKLGIAVNGAYTKLSTAGWDEYARSMGDAVESSASAGYMAALLRIYLRGSAPDIVSLDAGPLLLFPGGSERTGGRSYAYDFMNSPAFGGLAAIEYDRCLGEDYAVYLRVAAMYVPSALQYADGWSPAFISIPMTAGVRMMF